MKKNLIFCGLLLVLFATKSRAQQPAGIGQWQSFLPYNIAMAMADAGDRVYFCTDVALYEVDKATNAIQLHNKITGLSDMGINTIAFNQQHQKLVIAYTNANVDVLDKDGGVTNFSAIVSNTNLTGSKNINHLFMDGSHVYLSCDFGVVLLDLDQQEFSQTIFAPQHITYTCTRLGDELFIGTNKGIYKNQLQSSTLLDFNTWQKQDESEGLTSSYKSKILITIKDTIYADINDTLMQYHAGVWQHIAAKERETDTLRTKFYRPGIANYGFSVSADQYRIIVTHGPSSDFITEYDRNSNVFYDNAYYYGFGMTDMEEAGSNEWWGASYKKGAWRFNSSGWVQVTPVGPKDKIVSDMLIDDDGALWATGTTYEGGAKFDKRGTYVYNNGTWANYDYINFPELDEFYDHVRIAMHPQTKDKYIASFLSGLLRITPDNTFTIYNQYTPDCALGPAVGDFARTRVHGLDYDQDNNLWMTNNAAVYSIVVMRNDETWKSFESPYTDDLGDILVDHLGYKWIIQQRGKVLVFDEGDMEDDSDNRYYQISTANELGSDHANCLALDRESGVWVGTAAGITIFNCGQDMFTEDCVGDRPVINPDNFNGHLLESENVRTIAVDGANRKWVGTDNGLFLLSADGYEQLAYYTTHNSPLFDNVVKKVMVAKETGMVYIATEKGLQAIRGEATEAEKTMSRKTANVYPNPVRPDYEGLIGIDNLTEDAHVKITDVSGRLVYQTRAYGGQAVWNGADYNGRKAATGVYLVFAVSEDGKEKMVSKLVFLP